MEDLAGSMSEHPPCMDNNRLIVVSATYTDFSLAMQLAFRHHRCCVGWSMWEPKPKRTEYNKERPEELSGVCGKQFLVLHWCKPDSSLAISAFPMEMSCELATKFAWDWLNNQKYEHEPDHDGSNHHGFIVFNEAWGHVDGQYSAIAAIGPAWAMAGK